MASFTDLLGTAGDTIYNTANSLTDTVSAGLEQVSKVTSFFGKNDQKNNTAAGTSTSGATVNAVVTPVNYTPYIIGGVALVAVFLILKK